MRITGQVIDFTNGTPIQGATIAIHDNFGDLIANLTQTNASGYFSADISQDEWQATDIISVTCIGYKGLVIAAERMEPGIKVQLQKNYVDLPPVVVTATKKNKWLGWALLIGLILIANKK